MPSPVHATGPGCSSNRSVIERGAPPAAATTARRELAWKKSGLPIALSIIFLHLAQRVGLNAAGVGLPGHFIVKVTFELNEVYVDPFGGGTTLTLPEIGELLSRISDRQIRLANEHLAAWTPRQTLIRLLANLENMWRRAGDSRRAASARERLLLLDASPPAR